MQPRPTALGILAALAFAAATDQAATISQAPAGGAARSAERVRDIDGRPHDPFKPTGPVNVIFFVATDCPVSNSYAPEIQRTCRDYRSRGVSCLLSYEDVDHASSSRRLDEHVKEHLREYRYTDIPAVVDRSRIVARETRASITPQAVVIDRTGKIRYRGRIDNLYVALGRRRQTVTEHDLRDALDAVLDGHPVPKVETEALGCYIVDPVLLRK